MTPRDLAAVNTIAVRVHPDYPEDAAVFAERLALHAGGCFILQGDVDPVGYLISHPWHFAEPPALNVQLRALPAPASTYYIHDLALLPEARGSGAAAAAVRMLIPLARTQDMRNISLVAVNNSVQFWQQQGFHIHVDDALAQKLMSYDAAACYMVRDLSSV
ncbi:GNAT superfamily N-acetyltransferase [Rhodopseudomonas rhenobacensis]|uniref:GNAT superfamily N-acetyltransferase n=1 Tax=Rhodopseudomonas rhenobacensis TaxID=87461 RepID=A0A7W7Z6H8_9BRAD|nr:GNAT family N-acetyltransferase [Rhodopseudomonas rhenobacensis]MBB5048886.1 GNAT superfamily N-acetyltransferase [Rhodopseudomonas rhenobacensis]